MNPANVFSALPLGRGRPSIQIGIGARSLPPALTKPNDRKSSTQEGFGKILNAIAAEDSELSRRIVTTSPDVSVSTNLGAWINRRGLFGHSEAEDVFRELKVVSAQLWRKTPRGQHIELGIAENNLFIQLAALGLSHELFGTRLLPIGTLYDPFINRGLDALNYACYQDARFMIVATPSGVTLAPEGGAHQSIHTPLIGIGQPGLTYFEPAFADELALVMRWAFAHMQADDGGSVYLRLTTRAIEQVVRDGDAWEADALKGGYWLKPPAPLTEAEHGVRAEPVYVSFVGHVTVVVDEALAIVKVDDPPLPV